MDIKTALSIGKTYLSKSLYIDPNFELSLVLSKLLNKDRSYLIAHSNERVDETLLNEYFNILKRRQKGEPLQYIFGSTYFYGRDFKINNKVLIPRPDTEISIEILKRIFEADLINSMLEIGCGSGIVTITMAIENENKIFDCVDISEDAIGNTKENIDRYNLKNIKVFKSDIYENVKRTYDIIYSNPPYIPTKDIENLQVEIKSYEPIIALDGGKDGLDFYRRIIKDAYKFLNNKGYIVFEIGYNQKDEIEKLLYGYNTICIKDLSNKDRVIVASKGEIDVRKFRSI